MQALPKTLPAFFWHFLKPHWKMLAIIQILSFAWSLDHTLWPYVIMVLIDSITNYVGDRSDIWQILSLPIIMGISLWILVEVSTRISGILLARLIPKIEAAVRRDMFDYIQHHSFHYFSNHMSGAIANKISDIPQSLTRLLLQVIQLFLPVLLALLISTVLLTRINPLFGALLATWVFIHLGICLSYAKTCDSYAHIHAEARNVLSGKIVDSLTNNTNVRLFSRYRFESHYLSLFQKDEQKKHSQSLLYIEKIKIVLGIVVFLGAGIALNGFMIYSWQKGQITAGEVVFIFNTNFNITMMAWLAGLEFPQLFKEIGICRQAVNIAQDSHDIIDKPGAQPLRVTQGKVVFKNVTFRYRPGMHLFQNKNIILKAGEKVGLVGFSGSGKTTFVNLILRYFDIEQGQILIDGQDISQVTQESLRERIAVIPQDPILFHRTLMDNIRYSRLNATDDEVIEASKKAHCHEFIQKMPEKYQSFVGERGIKLSGGQRQRIAIARAILKNAPILILDEATSALDSVTEKEIQESLDLLMAGHTTIVIAHRLSTLSGMDRILVFKDGQVVEDGTHEELLQEQGHYAQIWDMQAGGFLIDGEEEEEG